MFAGAKHLLEGESRPSAIMFEADDVNDHATFLARCGYDVRAVHYSLRHGLQFIQPAHIQVAFGLREGYAGQGTLDYLALDQTRELGSFEDLTERSVRKIPPALRVLAKYF